MFLSFIVPVYNVEKYLSECLDSLLDQDIPHDDYEIICINDGSTDGSLTILRDYASKHSNIRIINQENSGVASARNAGLDAAQGEYIWFFDSDDICAPNCLYSAYCRIKETSCDRLQIGVYTFTKQLTREELNSVQNKSLKVNSHYQDSTVWGSILRRDFLIKHNCYFHYPQISHGEDSLYMAECVQQLPYTEHYDQPLYLYRIRSGSAQQSQSTQKKEKQLRSYLQATVIMKRHYEAGTKTPEKTADMLMTFLWITIHWAICASKGIRKEIMKELRLNGLFPFRRPAACTLMRSYQTTRTDIVGKVFDKIYINLHRPWGFAAMVLLQNLVYIKKKLVK